MELAVNFNKKVGVCDIETMTELFDVGCYDPDTKENVQFEISAFKNDLYALVKWYTSKPFDYLITFNGIRFDQPVMEYIVENYDKWFDLSNLQICEKIAQYAQKVIDDSNYGLPSRYQEKDFQIKPIDVFRIHHFDNEAKRTSLKWCAFMLNMDVEEMPIHHAQRNLTQDQIEMVRNYRFNDQLVTLGVLYLTMGQIDKIKELNGGFDLPELADYKGKNKIQDRLDVYKETGLSCMNLSDVTLGEEWNKMDYLIEEKIQAKEAYTKLFSRKVKHPYGQKFKNFFPSTMQFTTDKMKKFVEEFGNQYVKAEKQEFHVTVGSTKYTIAKGGIHSNEKNRKVQIPKGWILRDADVGSQYPNSIVKLNIYAPHLSPTIMSQFKGKIQKRLIYKDKGGKLKKEGKVEEARPYMSVQDMLKLCLNGGYYGKLGQKGSFLEYPEGLLKVCIGNQIEILMLIEALEDANFQVISGNTDGIVTLFPEEREEEYYRICHEWEDKVGNMTMGKLEYADFVGFWQDHINSYIGRKIDRESGKLSTKKKGRFMTEFEMHKNKSMRIIPLALEAYFIDGKDPIEFITSHGNIFDFCLAKKSGGDMYYEEEKDGKTTRHKKLVRFFVSTNGSVLWKRGVNYEGQTINNQVLAPKELGQPLVTYFNKYFKSDDYQIDYSFYVYETLKRIDEIEKTNKAQKYVESLQPTVQGSLF